MGRIIRRPGGAGLAPLVAQALADTAQSADRLEATAGLTPVPTEADLAGRAAGGYTLVATGERVWWSGSAVTQRRVPGDPNYVDARTYGLSLSNTGEQNRMALVAALAAAKAVRKHLFLPPGDYAIDPISVAAWSGMRVFGAGSAWGPETNGVYNTRLICNTAGADAFTVTANGAEGKNWNARLEDFDVVSVGVAGAPGATRDGIVLGSSNGVLGPFSVTRVGAYGHGRHGFNLTGKIDQMLMTSVIARNNGANGINVTFSNLISELTLISCHGNFNYGVGLFISSFVFKFTSIGSEYGGNMVGGVEVSSANGGNTNGGVLMGNHFEGNAAWDIRVGGAGLGPVGILNNNFMHSSPAGQAPETSIRVRVGISNLRIIGNTFALRETGPAAVIEEGDCRIRYDGNRVGRYSGTHNVYLRKRPDGSLTNETGGGTAQRPAAAVSQSGDLYANTDTNTLDVFVNGAWAPAGGGTSRVWIGAAELTPLLGPPIRSTASNKVGTVAFNDSASQSASATIALPQGWGAAVMDVYWTAAGAGDCRWDVELQRMTDGTSLASNGVSKGLTATSPANVNTVRVTRTATGYGIGTEPMGMVRVYRRGADAADTLAGDAHLIGVMLVKTV